MNFNLATIKIKNLRLRTYIGINEDEIKNKQDVVVNVKIDYDAEKATNTDGKTYSRCAKYCRGALFGALR